MLPFRTEAIPSSPYSLICGIWSAYQSAWFFQKPVESEDNPLVSPAVLDSISILKLSTVKLLSLSSLTFLSQLPIKQNGGKFCPKGFVEHLFPFCSGLVS